jgi:hypothetical protein
MPTSAARKPEAEAIAFRRGNSTRWTRRTVLGVLAASLAVLVGIWPWPAGAEGGGRGLEAQAAGPDSCGPFDQEHAAWTSILSRYVRAGFVDYAGLERSGLSDLSTYLHALESVCRGHFDTWSREEKLAFWINAYNAYTVKLILDHYPLRSIRSIGFLPGAAFREDFIPLGALRGHNLSLNDIEHEILRREFHEPRIHFAIVCASKSCPMLRSEAYRARDLEAQLDEAARSFVRDPSKNRFDARTRTLSLSAIFKWFRADFESVAGTLPEFVARYTDEGTARALRAGGIRVEFLDYDWSLNGR